MSSALGGTTRGETSGRPLRRLAVVHGLNQAGEACFAVSLAGSLFFGVSVDAARPLIILYLLLTMAPFAVVLPMIGPVIDRLRGGQRGVILAALIGRAGIFMLLTMHLERLAFYPEAFAALVLAKTYMISKAAIVPRVEGQSIALVRANSLLSVAGGVGGAAGGAAAAALLALTDATWVLWLGAAVLVAAAIVAASLPAAGAVVPASQVELPELRSPFIRAAAVAVGSIRLGIGFMFFHLAFTLKQEGEPLWVFGVVLAAGALGGFVGSLSAPVLRRRVGEDRIILIVLTVAAFVSAIAALRFHIASAVAVAAALGLATTAARHGFDSLVQREAPDADAGRAFSRFETRFQLAWVLGALIPVVARPSDWIGMLLLAAMATYAAGAYAWEVRTLGHSMASTGEGGLVEGLLQSAHTHLLSGARRQAVVIAAAAAEVALSVGTVAQEPVDLLELRRLRDGVVADATQPPEARVERALALARRVVADARLAQSED